MGEGVHTPMQILSQDFYFNTSFLHKYGSVFTKTCVQTLRTVWLSMWKLIHAGVCVISTLAGCHGG